MILKDLNGQVAIWNRPAVNKQCGQAYTKYVMIAILSDKNHLLMKENERFVFRLSINSHLLYLAPLSSPET